MVRGMFRTQASIYDGAFLWIYPTAYNFCNKTPFTDVPLGYIYVGLQKYWNFQSEAKVEEIFMVVTCKSTKMVKPDLLCM